MIKLVAYIFVILGAINWGLAVFGFNIYTWIFSPTGVTIKVFYGLTGLSGIYMLIKTRHGIR